jgi:hypothetical protein
MKSLSYLITAFFVLLMFTEACKIDRCKDTVCVENSVCNEGNCDCLAGYEGIACDVEIRTKFLASYNVNAICTSDTSTYSLTIAANPDDVTKVLISNIRNTGGTFEGSINDEDGLTIPSQPYDSTGTISGSVKKDGKVSFIVNNNGVADTCSFTLPF